MILWSTWSVNFIIHHTKLVSISLLEAQLSELEFLCYDKLHTAKPLLLFKDTVDLQGQFFFFHVKPSIAIKTKISESVLKNIEKRASYLLKRIFGKKVCILTCHKNDSKSIFAAKHLGSWNSIAYTCPRFSFTVWSLLSVYNWTVNRETEKRMRVAIRNSKRRQAGSERNIKESWRGMAKISCRDGLGLLD